MGWGEYGMGVGTTCERVRTVTLAWNYELSRSSKLRGFMYIKNPREMLAYHKGSGYFWLCPLFHSARTIFLPVLTV